MLHLVLCLIVVVRGDWKWLSGYRDFGAPCRASGGPGSCIDDSTHPGARSSGYAWNVGDDFYYFGGMTYTKDNVEWRRDMYVFDGADWTWLPYSGQAAPGASDTDYDGGAAFEVDATYHPSRRSHGSTFVANLNGNTTLFMFGGLSYRALVAKLLNDLWMYDVSTRRWGWVRGVGPTNDLLLESVLFAGGVGDPYTPRFAYGDFYPGGRRSSASWFIGNVFYVFGGQGYDSTNVLGVLGDLWGYNVVNDEWACLTIDPAVGDDYAERMRHSGMIQGRDCSYSTLDDETFNPPCARVDAITWVYGGQGYLYGGYLPLASLGRDDRPEFLGIFYAELYRFNPANAVSGLKPWTKIGGTSPSVSTDFTGNDIFVTAERGAADEFYTWSDFAHPGGLAGAQATVIGDSVIIFGGVGFGTYTNDFSEYENDGSKNFYCGYLLTSTQATPAAIYNASCGGQRDVWAYSISRKKWSYLEGEGDTEDFLHYKYYWTSWYVDDQWTLGKGENGNRPYGRGFYSSYPTSDGMILFGGGGDSYFYADASSTDDDQYVFSDVWQWRPISCDSISKFNPLVCSGHGECTDSDVCECATLNYIGQFCQETKHDVFVCGGIDPDDEDVCNGHGVCETKNTCVCEGGWDSSVDEPYCSYCPAHNCTGWGEKVFDWNLVGYIGGGVAAGLIGLCFVAIVILAIIGCINNKKKSGGGGGRKKPPRARRGKDTRMQRRGGKGKGKDDSDGEWTDGSEEESEGEWTDDDYV